MLSNSHAAALRLGWDKLGDSERLGSTATFFASRQSRLKALRARDGNLVCVDPDVAKDIAYTSGGETEICPDDYDVFLVHALGFRYHYSVFNTHYYSRSFVAAIMTERWKAAVCRHLLEQVRRVTNKPIYLSPQPYLSDADRATVKCVHGAPMRTWAIPELLGGSEAFGDAKLLWQPGESVSGTVFTHSRFSSGSVRLDVGDPASGVRHPRSDHQHMNARYGAHVWRAFFASCRGADAA